MALELRSQLCTFENSTKCNEISFDLHSFSEWLKGLLRILLATSHVFSQAPMLCERLVRFLNFFPFLI